MFVQPPVSNSKCNNNSAQLHIKIGRFVHLVQSELCAAEHQVKQALFVFCRSSQINEMHTSLVDENMF